MLAFAPPLSHAQSADTHSSTSVIRPRSLSRPYPLASSSSSSIPTVASHSSINGVHRTSSRHPSKATSISASSSSENRRDESITSRSVDPQSSQHDRPPASHPEPVATLHSRTVPEPEPLQTIHEQDPNKLLQLLASLLQQIASANDQIRTPPSSHETAPLSHPDESTSSPTSVHHPPIWSTLTTASRQAFSTPSSSLTFHARNIPTISLEAYLLRILKYCPTTNEVFLSLLVYFDRMSKLAFDVTGKGFAIDSFNVHRLVIAGVTVASKFFSDVFYTNSRYAKVGGLPQSELNQLELQFLLLNDFRLSIATEEMQRYAEQLQIYSRNSEAGLDVAPDKSQFRSRSQTPRDLIAISMRRMGVADVSNRRFPGEPMAEAESTRETDSGTARYQNTLKLEKKTTEERARQQGTMDRHSRESSTESGAETEEEGTETDDEPTIRAHSTAGSETQSLFTVESDYSERDDDDDDEGRTPERGATMSP